MIWTRLDATTSLHLTTLLVKQRPVNPTRRPTLSSTVWADIHWNAAAALAPTSPRGLKRHPQSGFYPYLRRAPGPPAWKRRWDRGGCQGGRIPPSLRIWDRSPIGYVHVQPFQLARLHRCSRCLSSELKPKQIHFSRRFMPQRRVFSPHGPDSTTRLPSLAYALPSLPSMACVTGRTPPNTRHPLRGGLPAAPGHRIAPPEASGQDLGGSILFGQRIGFSGTPSDLMPRELGQCDYEPGRRERGNGGGSLTIYFPSNHHPLDGPGYYYLRPS